MSTPLRSILSASVGPGLTVFTAASAAFNGPLAFSTTLGFGLTVVWGIVELALLSYTPVASIELDGPSLLLEDPNVGDEPTDEKLVAFSDPTPARSRAA